MHGASGSVDMQTPVIGSHGMAGAFVGVPFKTSTAAHTKSAQQATQQRKSGVTPETTGKKHGAGSHTKKSGIKALQSTMKSHATLKHYGAKPSQGKKLKRQSVGSTALLKAHPGASAAL